MFQRSPLMSQSPTSCGGILDAQRAGRNLNLTLPPPHGDVFVFTFAIEVAEIRTKCFAIIGDGGEKTQFIVREKWKLISPAVGICCPPG